MISILFPFAIDEMSRIIFYFTVYSFLGWLLENSYSFVTEKVFLKPNFFRGPFKPMYGFAPVLLLLFIDNHTTWPGVIFLCFFIPAIVEYVSGTLLQKVFHRQYWDYSDIPFQLHGHICLPFCLCWILLSIICLKWIHPLMISIYETVDLYWSWVFPGIIFYFLTELFFAIKKHGLFDRPAEEPTNTL